MVDRVEHIRDSRQPAFLIVPEDEAPCTSLASAICHISLLMASEQRLATIRTKRSMSEQHERQWRLHVELEYSKNEQQHGRKIEDDSRDNPSSIKLILMRPLLYLSRPIHCCVSWLKSVLLCTTLAAHHVPKLR